MQIKNYIICGLVTVNIITATFCFGLHYRLEQTRQQLESARMELSAATNRQSELAEILRRDGEILRESSATISGIRSQIAVIRESYEEMANILYSNNISSDK
jgi:aspartate carbamoyltransferase catalytic subunit